MSFSSVTQQPLDPELQIDPTAWQEIVPQVFQRPCIAQEQSCSFNQNIADGHTELTCSVTFKTDIPVQKVVQKARNAWLTCKHLTPVSSIELSTDLAIPQLMTYHVFTKQQQVDEWMRETFVEVHNPNFEEVWDMTYNRRLTTRGKQSMMYIITGDNGVHCATWNLSHVLGDAYSIIAWLNVFLKALVKCPDDQDIDIVSAPVDTAELLRRLPASQVPAYERKYNPGEHDRALALAEAKQQMALYGLRVSSIISKRLKRGESLILSVFFL